MAVQNNNNNNNITVNNLRFFIAVAEWAHPKDHHQTVSILFQIPSTDGSYIVYIGMNTNTALRFFV